MEDNIERKRVFLFNERWIVSYDSDMDSINFERNFMFITKLRILLNAVRDLSSKKITTKHIDKIMIIWIPTPKNHNPRIETNIAPVKSYSRSMMINGAVFATGMLNLFFNNCDFINYPSCPGVADNEKLDK